MATITRVTMGREGHYRYLPLIPGTSTMDAAECECGATWIHGDERWDGFCDWAMAHQTPTIRQAFTEEACPGSGGLIDDQATDGNGIGWCPSCQRYRPTSPQAGYDHWRQFDPHPVLIAVQP